MRLLLSLERAAPGDTFRIVNDRDPDSLLHELKPILDQRFTFWCSDAGPEIWRTFISCEEPIRGIPENQAAELQVTRSDPQRNGSLKDFARDVRAVWTDGGLKVPARVKGILETLLARTSPQELWIGKLIKEGLQQKELCRDEDHGFTLTGHVLAKGHAEVPHDHGSRWVLYGVYHGACEITTYSRIENGAASERTALGKKELSRLTPGAVALYRAGEIHSIFVSEPSVLLRFVNGDPGRAEGHRYVCDGVGFRTG
jgi:uncharacterized protein (DUF2249 family)/predicted metal-dependent enzyme (double-stranded beta helix superfamily)